MEASASRHGRGWADRTGKHRTLPLLGGEARSRALGSLGPGGRRRGGLRPALRLLAAICLGSLALVAPADRGLLGLGPATAAASAPLPACRYDGILTSPRRYVDWQVTLVDTILRVPSTYAPPDLVPVGQAGIKGVGLVRAVAVDDLRAMAEAARKAGSPIAVASAYRSYAMQQATFKYWVSVLGYSKALRMSARPGHSEHQLGVAIDFRSEPGGAPWNGGDWAATPAGKWMKANAWRFGWILSYPKGAFAKVCYDYEPWHWRYFGRDLAARIHASGLTIREYLWANFTTAVVGPPASPRPSGSPAESRSPSSSPDLASSSPSETTSSTPESAASAAASAAPSGPSPPAAGGGASPVGFIDTPEKLAVAIGGLAIAVVVGLALLVGARRARRRAR
jgi:D-alanyl-D-alanine carboxypeptidase